ncbi:enoyl-CoA hydratase/isomerase family protein [Sneathiella limimaris]|uniref:enoyl-CoA hydratase/isomerase family protein n=1 Tax=Sneathiella limimaris TaxID=1964213 RepID=UPI00146D8EA4|nr:enoyl-CoA hydratase-related protein [Sneathiella limimaris]
MGSFFTKSNQDGVLTITLQKPKQHNVLNPDEMAELEAYFREVAEDETLRVAVLTGEGKSFCAGANLGELGDYDFSKNPLECLTDAIENFPVPVICKLNGGVYGGGTDLALACDFRVGTPNIKCFIPPAKIGIHYHPFGMARAVSRLGIGPAKRLFLAVETMDGEELKSVGFLDYLVPEGDLDYKVATLVSTFKSLAPLSLRGMKATFNDIASQSFDLETAREAQIRCMKSEDFVEGRAAMAEKRPPNFKGR